MTPDERWLAKYKKLWILWEQTIGIRHGIDWKNMIY